MELIEKIKKILKNLKYSNNGKKIYDNLINNYGDYLNNNNGSKTDTLNQNKKNHKKNKLQDKNKKTQKIKKDTTVIISEMQDNISTENMNKSLINNFENNLSVDSKRFVKNKFKLEG